MQHQAAGSPVSRLRKQRLHPVTFVRGPGPLSKLPLPAWKRPCVPLILSPASLLGNSPVCLHTAPKSHRRLALDHPSCRMQVFAVLRIRPAHRHNSKQRFAPLPVGMRTAIEGLRLRTSSVPCRRSRISAAPARHVRTLAPRMPPMYQGSAGCVDYHSASFLYPALKSPSSLPFCFVLFKSVYSSHEHGIPVQNHVEIGPDSKPARRLGAVFQSSLRLPTRAPGASALLPPFYRFNVQFPLLSSQ